MTDAFNPDEDRSTQAGELALRLLSPAEEAEARARRAIDPAFAAEVDAWNTRLTAFIAEVPEVEPTPGVWARINAAMAGAANDNGRLAFWRRWAIGSTGLLAASMVAVIVLASRPEPVAPPSPAPLGGVTRVATLQLEGGASVVTLAYDTATGRLYVAPNAEMQGEAGVPHLWLVMPEGGVQLVGAIDPNAAATHSLDKTLGGMAGQAQAFAISMEAPGHTPGATQPDGPVVASGTLERL